MITIARLLLLVGSLLLSTDVGRIPGTIYVSSTGKDSGPCTIDAPCRSVERAETLAVPGDTVQVAPGVYAGGIRLTKSGLPGQRIVYRGHDGVCPSTPNSDPHAPSARPNPDVITDSWTIEASNVDVECFKIRPSVSGGHGISITGVGTGSSAAVTRSFIDLSHNYVEYAGVNCTTGISLVSSSSPEYQSRDIRVFDNFITGCAYGINVRAVNTLVERNEVYDLRAWLGVGDMDYMRLFGLNVTVRNNYFHGSSVSRCNGEDCHIDCIQTFNVSGEPWAYLHGAVIDGNTCFNAHQGIMMQDVSNGNPGTPSGSHNDIMVTNNVIGYGPVDSSSMAWCMLFNSVTNVSSYHNTCVTGQVRFRAGSTAVHRNNVHIADTSSPADSDGTGRVTILDNLFYFPGRSYSAERWPGNILNKDPLLTNAAARDFHLTARSPGRGAGAGVGVMLDRDGVARPVSGPDLGAYQFVPARPLAPVAVHILPAA